MQVKQAMRWTGAAVAVAVLAGAAAAQKDEPRAAPLARLVECRAIADPGRRLACYDEQVAVLDRAERDKEVVIVDRGQIRKARRTLFGLNLPDFSLFGGGDKKDGPGEEEGISRIDSTIRSAGMDANGRWTLVLADGARWVQADTRNLSRSPRAGMPIAIRRAAMGSFLANIDKQIAIRVRRVN